MKPAAWIIKYPDGVTISLIGGTCPKAYLPYAKPLCYIPEGLEEFEEGQWWLKELDAAALTGPDDLKRAVAVVRNLLRTAKGTT